MYGLSSAQVKKSQIQYGFNEIPSQNRGKFLWLVLNQFKSAFVYVLLFATILSFLIGNLLDAYVILFILLVNGLVGFLQEYKAEKALDSLRSLVKPTCKVYRDGKLQNMDIKYLVPDDLVLLSEGDRIPADGEVVRAFSAQVDESTLSGESQAVPKSNADAQSTLFKGTLLLTGRIEMKVTKIGRATEFGQIVDLLEKQKPEPSLLATRLNSLALSLTYIILLLFAILFGIGFWAGVPVLDMLMTSIALSVSAIPEGLPIIVTLTLAFGAQVMARKKAIVRKMNAVETLGSTTVICTDKTGTLTLNQMTATRLWTLSGERHFEFAGYDLAPLQDKLSSDESLALEIANYCNNAQVESSMLGDPTEVALKVLAYKFGLDHDVSFDDEIAFTSERKMMSVYNCKLGKNFIKGAPEVVLASCTSYVKNGKVHKLNTKLRELISTQIAGYEKQAMRVLALAYKSSAKISEQNLVFTGLVALQDAPRPEVAKALQKVWAAHIQVKVITGDSLDTALSIAAQIGFEKPQGVLADKIESLNAQDLYKLLQKVDVIARAKPHHKYQIVKALQAHKQVVAAFGDGVNDAPALKCAEVGVAMGIQGTEAAKEVSDLVLQDDNFACIVDAIYEGRRIYQNIVSFTKYMLSANFASISTLFITLSLGFPLAILPLQILWINLATDALPALALGNLKGSKSLMLTKPRLKSESILQRIWPFVCSAAIVQGLACLLIFYYGYLLDVSLGLNFSDFSQPSIARTLVFTEIVFFELFMVYACIPKYIPRLSNLHLNLAVLVSGILQLLIIYMPFAQLVFKTVPLSLQNLFFALGLAASAFLVPGLSRWLFPKSSQG